MIGFVIVAVLIIAVLGMLLKAIGLVIGVVIAIGLVSYAMKKYGN